MICERSECFLKKKKINIVFICRLDLSFCHPLVMGLKIGTLCSILQVDESVNKLDSQIPPIVKKVSSRAISAAKTAPSAARAVASEVKNGKVVETTSGLAKTAYTKYEPTAKELYSKYEPVAEQYAVSAWRSLNQLPLFPQVAKVVVPTAAYCSEKYNQTVKDSFEKGYKVSSYLPLVPTEKISRVFGAEETASAH